jgi:hypothetical protein
MRLALVLAACACIVEAQNATANRQKAAEYPVSASAERVQIGAEFLVHAIPSQSGYYFAKNFLVVDVGMFPRELHTLKVSANQFTLRLNGHEPALTAQSPGMVAASLKYPDWGMPNGVSVSGDVGGIGMSTDRRPVGRFPGDPNAPAPDPNNESGPDYQLSIVALPDAFSAQPVRGCVFFESAIKPKKIKSVELDWTGPAGEHLALKLR